MEPNLPNSEILFKCVCTPGLLGYLLANNFVDPWYWVNRSISHGILPIKENNCNKVVYGILLYCSIANNLCDCVGEIVRA